MFITQRHKLDSLIQMYLNTINTKSNVFHLFYNNHALVRSTLYNKYDLQHITRAFQKIPLVTGARTSVGHWTNKRSGQA